MRRANRETFAPERPPRCVTTARPLPRLQRSVGKSRTVRKRRRAVLAFRPLPGSDATDRSRGPDAADETLKSSAAQNRLVAEPRIKPALQVLTKQFSQGQVWPIGEQGLDFDDHGRHHVLVCPGVLSRHREIFQLSNDCLIANRSRALQKFSSSLNILIAAALPSRCDPTMDTPCARRFSFDSNKAALIVWLGFAHPTEIRSDRLTLH